MPSRRDRAFQQPIYLLRMKTPDAALHAYERIFNVVGTTGNIYEVKINETPQCSCPDCADNGNICKHIYFIILCVMKIDDNVKRRYNKQQLVDMFNRIPNFITRGLTYNDFTKDNIVEQKIDDVCPVCLEDIDKKENTVYCKYSCGKSVHKLCFNIWSQNNNESKCLFCRCYWSPLPKDLRAFPPEDCLSEDYLSEDYLSEDCLSEDYLSEHYLSEDYLSENSLSEDHSEDYFSENSLSENHPSNAPLSTPPLNAFPLDTSLSAPVSAHLLEANSNYNKYQVKSVNINQLKLHQLQEICRNKGLPYYGTKKMIIDRLNRLI